MTIKLPYLLPLLTCQTLQKWTCSLGKYTKLIFKKLKPNNSYFLVVIHYWKHKYVDFLKILPYFYKHKSYISNLQYDSVNLLANCCLFLHHSNISTYFQSCLWSFCEWKSNYTISWQKYLTLFIVKILLCSPVNLSLHLAAVWWWTYGVHLFSSAYLPKAANCCSHS